MVGRRVLVSFRVRDGVTCCMFLESSVDSPLSLFVLLKFIHIKPSQSQCNLQLVQVQWLVKFSQAKRLIIAYFGQEWQAGDR